MRNAVTILTMLLLAGAAAAQSRSGKVTAEEVQELRQALEAQQQQIQQLRQEIQQRDQAWQQVQQQLQLAQSTASEARTKAAAAESSSSSQQASVTQLESDLKDVKNNMTAVVTHTQEEQKRFSALEGLVSRFRWSGDIRVRQEDFFQSHSGCAGACNPRVRERVRLRFGFEGKLGEDFIGGMFLASGAITDPTSTNETFTSAFERKTISFDRGYVIYHPHAHKWLTLTGGKFAYTWKRTPQTFDSDLNPEGFSEKVSFDLKDKVFKNVTFTGMQLLYNEVNRATAAANCVSAAACVGGGSATGGDSFAAGGQVGVKLQLGERVTLTPTYGVLNWRNQDALLNGAFVGQALNGGPNGITNSTFSTTTAGGGTAWRFLSRFLYSDLIVDATVKTGWERWPWNVRLEYLDNLNAADHPLAADRTTVLTNLGRQSHLYLVETSLGRLKNPGDWKFTYSFWRQEQDSVIASFDQSDQRAPTNVIQHFLYAQYKLRHNMQLEGSLWIGRTLNSNLANAARAPGVAAGAVEPYLKRVQLDAIYSF
jgi:hypothetical protein